MILDRLRTIRARLRAVAEYHEAWAAAGVVIAVVFLTVAIWTAPPSAREQMRDDMRRVERVLVDAGYPAAGFADTPTPDLSFLNEVVAARCVRVSRAGWLARLAVKRQMPEFEPVAAYIAVGVAAAVARDTGKLDCFDLGDAP